MRSCRPHFDSRRTGHKYKTAKELHEYFDTNCPDFEEGGDIVLHCVWRHPPYEIRLGYVFMVKLPKENLVGESWEMVRVRYNFTCSPPSTPIVKSMCSSSSRSWMVTKKIAGC